MTQGHLGNFVWVGGITGVLRVENYSSTPTRLGFERRVNSMEGLRPSKKDED